MLKAFADGQVFGAVHGSGEPWLLCLPGWGRTHADFEATVEGLDAIVLDLPGFGASPLPPAPWGAAEYARVVDRVLEEMAAPNVILGHSFGGRVAVHVASASPHRVGGLVLTAVPLVRGASAGRRPAPAYRVARALHRRGLISDQRMESSRHRHGSSDYLAAQGVMRQVHVKVVNESYEQQLAGIACPTELVWGDDDTDVPLSVAEAAREIVASAKLTVVPGAGHLTPLSAPGELRAAALRLKP